MRRQIINANCLCCCWGMTTVMAAVCCAHNDPMYPAFSLGMM